MKSFYILGLLILTQSGYAQSKLYPYAEGKKWGLTNSRKQVLITPQYDTVSTDRIFARLKKDGRYGLADSTGKVIVPCIYDQVFLAGCNGTSCIGKLSDKFLFLDLKTGQPAGISKFDEIDSRCMNTPYIFGFKAQKKNGFVNGQTGKIIAKAEFDEYDDFYVGQARVMIAGKYGIIDLNTGRYILPVIYAAIEYSYEKEYLLKATSVDGKVTRFDAKGKVVVEKPVAAKSADADGDVYESAGIGVVEAPVADYSSSGTDRPKAGYGGGYGLELYIYKQGETSWKATIEKRRSDKTEIMETSPLEGYSQLEKFNYSNYRKPYPVMIKAVRDGKMGLIDFTGKEILPVKYQNIERIDGYRSKIIVTLDGKKGVLLESDLRELKKPVLKNIETPSRYSMDAGLLVEMQDGKRGFMNEETGEIYIPGVTE